MIEDDPDFVELVRGWLARFTASIRFELHAVGTLSGALSSLGESRADLAIVDLGLPDSRGLATLEKIASVAAPEIPIVVLSAEDDDYLVCDLLRAGAVDHIAKLRCTADKLVVGILNAIARHFESKTVTKLLPIVWEKMADGTDRRVKKVRVGDPLRLRRGR